jgi:hypothetical protein
MKAKVKKLKDILESYENTAEFLTDVQSAIESNFADDPNAECPDGFTALDEAIEAFSLAEAQNEI